MALPETSAYVVSQRSNDDPVNSRVIQGQRGIVISDSGPGGSILVEPTQMIGSIEDILTVGFLIREEGDVADTRILTTDGSINITNADGANGNPILSVAAGGTVQKVNVAVNGTTIGNRSTLNFIPNGGIGITATDNGGSNSIDIALSASGGGGGGSGTVTSVGITNLGGGLTITNSPITTSGDINIEIDNPGGGAPSDAEYIIGTADAGLPNAQALGPLSTIEYSGSILINNTNGTTGTLGYVPFVDGSSDKPFILGNNIMLPYFTPA
jgi:hypothetical protein